METNDDLSAELEYADLLVRAAAIEWSTRRKKGKQQDSFGNFPFTERSLIEYCDENLLAPGAGTEFSGEAMDMVHTAAELRYEVLEENQTRGGRNVLSLGARMGMKNTEIDALLIALLPEVDVRYAGIFSLLQYQSDLTRPTLALIFQLLRVVHRSLSKAHRDHVSCGHLTFDSVCGKWAKPLTPAPEGELKQMIEVDDVIVQYLLGCASDSLTVPSFVAGPMPECPLEELIISNTLRCQLERVRTHNGKEFKLQGVFFHGPYGSGRLKAARAMGQPVLVIDAGRALHSPMGWTNVLRFCYRLACCHCARVFWSGMDAFFESGQDRGETLQELFEEARRRAEQTHFPIVSYFAGILPLEAHHHYRTGAFIRVAVPMPGRELRAKIWEKQLPPSSAFIDLRDRRAFVRLLAQTYQLTEGQVADAVLAARSQAIKDSGVQKLKREHVESACRAQSGRILHQLAIHISPGNRALNDIILPPASRAQLENLQYRIKNRTRILHLFGFAERHPASTGLLALFTGGSGTGKTLASQIVASDNKVDLYKVDMAQLVSKWVGETEKNLSNIFAAASDSNAILFFDEADALFGKRGEVRDAQDRWANQEVNFLLQKIEEFEGVVIMATNLRQNIEPAFMRRIHAIIDFPAPDADARYLIWKKHLGEDISNVDDDDLREIAESFPISGGSIRNAVFEAAHIAQKAWEQDRDTDDILLSGSGLGSSVEDIPATITLRDVVLGVGREYFKLGKPVTRGEFGVRFYESVVADLFRAESNVLTCPTS